MYIRHDDRHQVTLTLNGSERSAHAESRTQLCDFLRHQLGVTGTHVGCEHGVCGACTVIVDGRATRSCLMLAVQAEGRRVETVESLGEMEGLDDLQRAFRDHHALQCGFCTAGILMSCHEFLRRIPDPSEGEVRDMLSGHLCRCTGYTGIVQAVLAVARRRQNHREEEQ
ncbi:2Fe-2S iron-sulfur cluster-binding protein [Chromohalobacter sp. 296-RDG]|uniref:(2Fe-2S)-binding protein n=1 Tax=Chromohalobacter sp. 296-RDG TaxID=2994062 RepID=UPI0024697742|nr:2Fe-2S iron-sulfur cluster-binding protein [Chromohalobacter sp. 296-RDG]